MLIFIGLNSKTILETPLNLRNVDLNWIFCRFLFRGRILCWPGNAPLSSPSVRTVALVSLLYRNAAPRSSIRAACSEGAVKNASQLPALSRGLQVGMSRARRDCLRNANDSPPNRRLPLFI